MVLMELMEFNLFFYSVVSSCIFGSTGRTLDEVRWHHSAVTKHHQEKTVLWTNAHRIMGQLLTRSFGGFLCKIGTHVCSHPPTHVHTYPCVCAHSCIMHTELRLLVSPCQLPDPLEFCWFTKPPEPPLSCRCY